MTQGFFVLYIYIDKRVLKTGVFADRPSDGRKYASFDRFCNCLIMCLLAIASKNGSSLGRSDRVFHALRYYLRLVQISLYPPKVTSERVKDKMRTIQRDYLNDLKIAYLSLKRQNGQIIVSLSLYIKQLYDYYFRQLYFTTLIERRYWYCKRV